MCSFSSLLFLLLSGTQQQHLTCQLYLGGRATTTALRKTQRREVKRTRDAGRSALGVMAHLWSCGLTARWSARTPVLAQVGAKQHDATAVAYQIRVAHMELLTQYQTHAPHLELLFRPPPSPFSAPLVRHSNAQTYQNACCWCMNSSKLWL
jgi:hypothetical protein